MTIIGWSLCWWWRWWWRRWWRLFVYITNKKTREEKDMNEFLVFILTLKEEGKARLGWGWGGEFEESFLRFSLSLSSFGFGIVPCVFCMKGPAGSTALKKVCVGGWGGREGQDQVESDDNNRGR